MNGISIIVLNWENPDRLEKCLEAIKNQDGYLQENIQTIVIDDGSTEDVHSVCQRYGAEFHTFPHSINIGKLFNFGFAIAKYETMLLITQDHVLQNNFLYLLDMKMGENKLIGAKILDDKGEPYYAARFRKNYADGDHGPTYFDGFGVAITKHNCPLFDTTEKGKIYQHANPRWLQRVQTMGVVFEYHEDLVITHMDHERRE